MDKNILQRAWVQLGDIKYLDIPNPLDAYKGLEEERPDLQLLRILRNPKYFYSTCKFLLDIDLVPMQVAVLQELWIRPFPMFIGTRGFSKSWLLAVLAILKCVLHSNSKVLMAGAAYRQSRILFEYIDTIWKNAPILRDIANTNGGDGCHPSNDRCTFAFGNSYAIAIPIGTGEKIRGLRSNMTICDEFDAIRPDIYERVIQGFGVVSVNPAYNYRRALKRKLLKEENKWGKAQEDSYLSSRKVNQSIISGTAGYELGHFCEYWKQYTSIINSQGNQEIIQDIFKGEPPPGFDWRDYSIIRIPYDLVPEGILDEKTIGKAKATNDIGTFNREYMACFSADSGGFFKRSLIEGCVTSDIKPIELPSGPVWFDATVRGYSNLKYVIGVDPASEKDNFTIFVLEIWEDHRRIVFGWSSSRRQFQDQQKHLAKKELNFFAYCARKIRNLMKVFPCEHIAMDSQGGGYAVLEALHDEDKLEAGEQPIWEVIDDEKEKPSDDKFGLHIVHLCQFRDSQWTAQANLFLKKDMEDKLLLFPRYDNISLELAGNIDQEALESNRYLDSLESCIYEIEELKNELTTIVMTKSPLGNNDRWDTPESKDSNGRKTRLRKDRYSAVLIANMIAHEIYRADPGVVYENIGGFTNTFAKKAEGDDLYKGPAWFTQHVNEDFYTSVRRS